MQTAVVSGLRVFPVAWLLALAAPYLVWRALRWQVRDATRSARRVNSGSGYLIGYVSKFVEVHGGISGGEDHSNIGREALQEQFMEEGSGISIVSEELLNTLEQLCWLAVTELLSTDELVHLCSEAAVRLMSSTFRVL